MIIKFLLTTILITAINAEDDVPLIEISNGWLQGTIQKSYNGRSFSSFEGISYARPPVDDLRFEAPLEPYNWTGKWMANTKHTCLQVFFDKVLGDEDCLYLNVYVPRTKPSPSDNFNVIVHIHGGGFAMMSAHTYAGPKYLMDEDVIFVTMNYRLGPFGFLSTEDDVIFGNNGLKDQVLALKWIQKNIKYFGGNPDSVTITGMSAGAASVHLHYFSPLSKGLFHRGVSQSGTALLPVIFQKSPLDNTKLLAKVVGCPIETSEIIKKCLLSRSGTTIVEEIRRLNLQATSAFDAVAFMPVIENEHAGAFITAHPLKLLSDKLLIDVPWITSVTEGEGLQSAPMLPKEILNEEYFNEFAPKVFGYRGINDEQIITDKIKQHYFEEYPQNLDSFSTIIGDRTFCAPADISAKLQAKATKSPVYFYNFVYRGEHTFTEYIMKDASHIGVASHGDDTLYYLYGDIAGEKLSEADEKMKSIFLQWIVSYADNKHPQINDINWKPVSGDEDLELLHIRSPTEISTERSRNFGSGEFWRKLLPEENDINAFVKDEL